MNFGFEPKTPTGSTPEALWAQWVTKTLKRLSPRNSPTVKIAKQDDYGYELQAAPAAPAGSSGSKILTCIITELYGVANTSIDYIGVTQFSLSGMATVGTQFFAAKCITGRQPAAETIDGLPITYTGYNAGALAGDAGDNTRTYNSAVLPAEYQVMNPRYMAYPPTGLAAGFDIGQFLVMVEYVQNGTGIKDANNNAISWQESQPFRNWCYSAALNGGND